MAVGQSFTGQVTQWTDPEFGYTVIQPLEQDGNRIMYFTSNCFCSDNESMVISAVRDGVENFYLLRFLEGTYTQLTDEHGIHISHAYFDKPRDTLYYTNGRQMKSVHIKTFEQKLIYKASHKCASIAVTCDGAYLLSSYRFPYSYLGNDQDERTIELFRMFKIHLATGEWSRILDRSFEIDHIQCSPTDPDHVIFCARGFFSTNHRIWHTNLDGTKGGALGSEQPNEHRTHEYYTPDGKRIAYHGKFFKIDKHEKFKNIGHTWGSMNLDGTDDTYYQCLRGLQAGHSSMSNNLQMTVTDGNDFLSLLHVDASKGEADFEPIFRHQSSMKSNFVHAHPCFSNDDRYIAFCTDFKEKDRGNLYLLDLQSKRK
ncbi:oligogalacturonate lyase family protein [Paenibacillus cremeus]|nr:oligogalacturonate lyase family protein [Paenibacillus cremeus]